MHLVDTTLFYSPTSGGVKRYLTAKQAWLRANTSWKHSILVPGEVEHLEPGSVSTVPGYHWPGTFNYRLPLNPRRWTRILDQLEPDLIEVGDAFHPAWCAWRVAKRRHIPLVAFYHSNMPQIIARRIGHPTERVLSRYVRWLYERCDAVLAPSRYMCDYLHSIGVTRATCQPLGVDVETFRPERRTRDLTADLNLPRGTRVLVFAGRFSKEKNIPVLTEAVNRLGDPYHLLLIGGDQAVREGNVTRIPYCRDNHTLASYIASADAFVHAGTHETFGLVVLEAMACGRPIVAMRAGALPELVDPSAGNLAEAHADPQIAAMNLADAIAGVYERNLDALGAAARRHVLANYSWSRALQSLMARYQLAVSARRLPVLADGLARAETSTH